MKQQLFWQKGDPIPRDLPSGRYILTFVGSYTLAVVPAAVVRTMVNRTIRYPGGHRLRIHSAELVKLEGDTAVLSIDCTLTGFPWALLLVALAAVAVALSLVTIYKMVSSGMAGAVTGVLLAVVALVLVVAFTVRGKSP